MLNRFLISATLGLFIASSACALDEASDDTTTPVANTAQSPHAKRGHHGKMDAAAHAAKLQDKLGLTDEQTTRVEQALASGSQEQQLAAMKEILTADQFAELERLMAEHEGHGKHAGHGKHGKGHGGHGDMDAAAHVAKLKQALALSDEQTRQVEAILIESQQTFGALHQRMVAAHDSKDQASADAIAALKAEKAQLKQARTAKLRAVLTAEQATQFDALVAKHHGKDAEHGDSCEACDHAGGCSHDK